MNPLINNLQVVSSDHPILYAVLTNDIEKVKEVLENYQGDSCTLLNKYDNMPLRRAVEQNNIDIVRYLIEKGSSVKGLNDSAYVSACKSGNLPMVKLLVKQGASIYAKLGQGIIWAAISGNLELLDYLKEKEVDFTERDSEVLRQVAHYEDPHTISTMKYLIQQGCDIHAYNDEILKDASRDGKTTIVEFCIEQGCDIDLANQYANPVTKQWIKAKLLKNKLSENLRTKTLQNDNKMKL